MKLLRWLVFQLRRLLGINSLVTRFDAVDQRLMRIEEQGKRSGAADEALPQGDQQHVDAAKNQNQGMDMKSSLVDRI